MLQALINHAKSAAASFIGTYLLRVSVAVPFLIALGFATVAAGLSLTERFGAKSAFWILAAGYCGIGALAGTLATIRQQQQEEAAEAEAESENSNTESSGLGDLGRIASAAATGATSAAGQIPGSLLASLMAHPTGPALAGARFVARNVPLILLAALLVLLLWRDEEADEESASAGETTGQTPEEPSDQDLREAA